MCSRGAFCWLNSSGLGEHSSCTEMLKQTGRFGNCFCKGNLGASAHTERCWEMLVAEGSRAGCASISSVFGIVYLHANEGKIISSREAVYQLLLGKKAPNPNSECQHVLTASCSTAPCQGTEKGDVWSRCPALCTVLRAKTSFSCSVLTPQNRSVNYMQNQWRVHHSQGSGGAVGNHSPLM